MKFPRVSVIVLTWNGIKHLEACLQAVLSQDYTNFELIIVDNHSVDGSADLVAEQFPTVLLIRNEQNLGFAGGCNVGLQVAQGEVLVLLNQDTVVKPGWLTALVNSLADEQVGIVGSKLLEADGRTISHAGGYLEWPQILGKHIGVGELDEGQFDVASDAEYVTGASLAIKRAVLDEIGLLDERFYPAYYEDVDLCWRTRGAGWRIKYEPRAVALHDESSSMRHHWPSKHYYHYRNRLLFLFKHYTPRQILTEFIPTEQERILHLSHDELRAGQVALVEILTMWPLMIREISVAGGSAAEIDALLRAIRLLREWIVYWQGGDPAFTRPRQFKASEMRRGEEILQPSLADALTEELLDLWEIPEPVFTSQVPLIGPLIIAFRNVWNTVATKWYIRPMLSQQVKFNGTVVRTLSAILRVHAYYWDNDALLVLLAERCGSMATQIAELKMRLARLEAQIKLLEEKDHE